MGMLLHFSAHTELKDIPVRMAEREYLIKKSLTALEKEFATRFVCIHRD